MPDLIDEQGEPLCWQDCETMQKVLAQFGMTDTGPIEDKNMYIMNNNATLKKVNSVMDNIKKRIKNNP